MPGNAKGHAPSCRSVWTRSGGLRGQTDSSKQGLEAPAHALRSIIEIYKLLREGANCGRAAASPRESAASLRHSTIWALAQAPWSTSRTLCARSQIRWAPRRGSKEPLSVSY